MLCGATSAVFDTGQQASTYFKKPEWLLFLRLFNINLRGGA
jgi:hypothetical protein